MGKILDILAEAKIREWQRRVESGQEKPASPGESATPKIESFESQLMAEILRLHAAARTQEDPSGREKLLRKARDLRTHLMVTLEQDRPLLARTLDDILTREIASLSREDSA